MNVGDRSAEAAGKWTERHQCTRTILAWPMLVTSDENTLIYIVLLIRSIDILNYGYPRRVLIEMVI